MTTTFDALARLLQAYHKRLRDDDYSILKGAIETMHDIQHTEGTHRIDGLIEDAVRIWNKRFQEWRRGYADIEEAEV